jgi:hypothetical protein
MQSINQPHICFKPYKAGLVPPHIKDYESGDEKSRGQLKKDTSREAPAGPLEVLLQEQEQEQEKIS